MTTSGGLGTPSSITERNNTGYSIDVSHQRPTKWGEHVKTLNELREIATRVRKRILRMAAADRSVHAGASLSVTDILVALYFGIGVRLEGPPTRKDWVILSKGHAVPALYAVLSELGILDEEELDKIRSIDGLEGHPEFNTPGVDVSTGSLGQGLSIGAGIAYAMRLDGAEGRYHVYVILGDGELDEGQVWEAATTAAHLRLRSLVAIVDVNGFQLDGPTEKIKSKGSLAARWSSIGWHVIEADGHSFRSLLSALEEARSYPGPAVVLAYTRRGRGLGLLEKTGEQHVNPEHAKQFIE